MSNKEILLLDNPEKFVGFSDEELADFELLDTVSQIADIHSYNELEDFDDMAIVNVEERLEIAASIFKRLEPFSVE